MEGELQIDKVFVRGLRFSVEKGDIEGAFAEYGLTDIVRIDVVRSPGQSLHSNSGCVAYVQFLSAHSASAALALDGRWSLMLNDHFHVKTCFRKAPVAPSWAPVTGPLTRPLWRSEAPFRFPPGFPPRVALAELRFPLAPLTPMTANLLAPDPAPLVPAPPLHSPPHLLAVAEGTTHVPRPPMPPPSTPRPTQPPLESLAEAVAEVLKKQVRCRSHEHCL